MTTYTARVLGGRRSDGSLREGPRSTHNSFWQNLGTVQRNERDAVQAVARMAYTDLSRSRRRAKPAPVVVAPHPRTCKKVLRGGV